jgi:hypothetical protein
LLQQVGAADGVDGDGGKQLAQAIGGIGVERQHAAAGAAREVLEQFRVAAGEPIRGVVQHDQANAARTHGVGMLAAAAEGFFEDITDIDDNADARVGEGA